MKIKLLMLSCLGVAAIALPSYIFHQAKPVENVVDLAPITLKAQQIAENLHAPTAAAFPGNGTIWVTEQTGKIRLIKNGKLSDASVLDLHSKLVRMSDSYDERGLLGIALHPKFSVNRKFYVFYSKIRSYRCTGRI
jgi:glucose/arabinose dehydrogenase